MTGVVIGHVLGYVVYHPSPQMEMNTMVMDTAKQVESVASTTPATMPGHAHVMTEVDKNLPIPGLKITATPDSKDGYNLNLRVTNFTFTPEVAGQAPLPNTGHAHLYINDVKVARIYSDWYYIPSSLLLPGMNYVMVTLNANDHSDWVKNNNHIGDVTVVTK